MQYTEDNLFSIIDYQGGVWSRKAYSENITRDADGLQNCMVPQTKALVLILQQNIAGGQ